MIYSAVIEKRNKSCKRIEANHLIVLCEVWEDYKSFCEDLENLIKSKRDKDLVKKVYHAIQGKSSFGFSKYKSFIEKHKRTIEIINMYSCLSNLTVLNYNTKGERRDNLDEDYFYQYISEHKADIDTIKAIALKIKDLGFDEITFGEKLDFTKIEYELDTSYRYEEKFAFLENMEVNPTYLERPIKYKTNGSCYCLILSYDGLGDSKKISKNRREIELNSLIFDPNRLPNEITTESTIGIIQELAEKKKVEHEDIQDSVDLSITTSDLTNYFEHLKVVSERINKVKDNQELKNLIIQMQNILAQLQVFGVNFESQVINYHPSISAETMEREKKLYLDRRYWASIDTD